MGLLRTILALVMVLILAHIVLAYAGVERAANVATKVVYGLGSLVESPATLIFGALGASRPNLLDPNNFLAVALSACAVYFILYLLLGVGRD